MRVFWEIVERMDQSGFSLKRQVEKLRDKDSFRVRMEKAVAEVRPPQRAITFDD
jgi:hypothetical protein